MRYLLDAIEGDNSSGATECGSSDFADAGDQF
jgi:hypothetical protein